MAVKVFQNAFTTGEVSPNLHGRTDFAKYAQGAERLKNMTVLVHGGAARRPGTFHIADSFDHEERSWLQPFIFSNEQAYVLEFAPFVIRFFRERDIVLGDGDGLTLILNSTFDSDLSSWVPTVGGTGAAVWNAGKARINGGVAGTAILSQGLTTVVGEDYVIEADISLQPISVAAGTALGLSDLLPFTSAFPGHVKLAFTATTTSSFIHFGVDTDANADFDNVTVQHAEPMAVASPYSAEEIPNLRFAQSADVLYITHQNHQPYKLLRLTDVHFELRPVNLSPPPTRELPQIFGASITLAALTGTNIQVDATAAVFNAGDQYKILRAGAGRASVRTADSATQLHIDIIDDFTELGPIAGGLWTLTGSPSTTLDPDRKGPVGAVVNLAAGADAFRASDVGNYIRTHTSGFIRLIGVASATSATGEILQELTGDTDPAAAIAGAWFIEYPIWTTARGWPGACCFHDQRLVMGGSPSEPLTFAGSVTGDFENFAVGPDDDDAYDYELVGGYNVIRWLVSQRSLMAGTPGAEHTVSGGENSTPHITPSSVFAQSDTAYGSAYGPAPLHVGNSVIFVQRGGQRLRELTYAFETDSRVAPDLSILAAHLTAAGIVQIARHTSPDSYILAVRADGALLVCAYERPEQVVAWSRWITGAAQDLTDGFIESVCVIPNPCDTGDEIWQAVRRRYFVTEPAATLTPNTTTGVVELTASAAVFTNDHLGFTITNIAGDGVAVIDVVLTAFTVRTHTLESFPSTEAIAAGSWDLSFVKRSIELYDGALNTDAAVRYEGVPITELTGLSYLHHVPVQVVADGVDSVITVAADGVLTLPEAASVVEAGIGYTSRIRTLRPEVSTPGGLSLGRRRRIVDALVRFYCCGPGWRVNGLETDLTGVETRLGLQNEATGFLEPVQDRRIPNLGWDALGRITVEQPRPFKGTVLAIGGRMEIEDDE